MHSTRLFLLVALLLGSTAAIADKGKMYKWTDENGVVHFSEAPPAAASANPERMNIPGVDPRDVHRARMAQPEEEEKPAEASMVATDARAAEELKKNCDATRRNIAVLKSEYSRVQAYNPDGTPQELNEAQRQKRLERERSYIATYCSNS